MKTNTELQAALNMVLARLASDPKTVAEWQAIEAALRSAAGYAGKCRAVAGLGLREDLKAALLAYEQTGDHNHGSRSLPVGAVCPGGDCNVWRARQLLLATDAFDAAQRAAAAKLVEFFEAYTPAKVSP